MKLSSLDALYKFNIFQFTKGSVSKKINNNNKIIKRDFSRSEVLNFVNIDQFPIIHLANTRTSFEHIINFTRAK